MTNNPYRGVPATRDAAEDEEVAAFARRMHAERRVWAEPNLGKAILALALAAGPAVCFFLTRSAMTPSAWPSAAMLACQALFWSVVGVRFFVMWLRAIPRSVRRGNVRRLLR